MMKNRRQEGGLKRPLREGRAQGFYGSGIEGIPDCIGGGGTARFACFRFGWMGRIEGPNGTAPSETRKAVSGERIREYCSLATANDAIAGDAGCVGLLGVRRIWRRVESARPEHRRDVHRNFPAEKERRAGSSPFSGARGANQPGRSGGASEPIRGTGAEISGVGHKGHYKIEFAAGAGAVGVSGLIPKHKRNPKTDSIAKDAVL
jgi:hypothetical protein